MSDSEEKQVELEDLDELPQEQQPFRWRSRLFAGIIMLLLSFIGLVITRVYPDKSWVYWAILSFVYAIICLWLSIFLSRYKTRLFRHLGQEALHWIASLIAIYIIILQVNEGVVGNLEGGITIMIILALATFIAGIYIDGTFMLVGFVLGVFTLITTLVKSFFILIALIVVIIAIIFTAFIARYKRERFE